MDLLLTIPTSMDHEPILNRDRQLSWLMPGSVIRQDQDLIDFIKSTGSSRAIGFGDVSYFNSHIEFVETSLVDLCIYIQTKKFDLDELITHINSVIDQNIVDQGKIYLAFNKYQIYPRKYAQNLPDDFDEAIGVYVKQKIHARIDTYKPCGLDGGNKFNWVHPLTRFYLTKSHDY